MSAQGKQDVCVHIRWMIRRDMSEVQQIESHCFEFPWSEEDFIRCLRQRNCIGMVAEHEERVLGFMIYELHKTRLHVLNFAVHPSHRRLGVGTAMAQKLDQQALAVSGGIGFCWKCGNESRRPALLPPSGLSSDFRAARFLRRYHRGCLLDAVCLPLGQPRSRRDHQPHHAFGRVMTRSLTCEPDAVHHRLLRPSQ